MKGGILGFSRIGRVRFLAYTNISLFFSVFLIWYVFPVIAYDLLEILFNSTIAGVSALYFMYAVFLLLPIKFLAQRYRDSGVPGWLALIGITPISFAAMYLMMSVFPGESTQNKYGSAPLAANNIEILVAILSGILIIPLFIWAYL